MHQFVRVGEHAMVGGAARITQDVAPYMIAEGNPAQLRTVNSIGLQRRGFSEEDVKALKFAYRKLFLDKKAVVTNNIPAVLEDEKYGSNPHVLRLVDFLRTSERGFIR
jgi:UDP-N-acetylglucosamine acyltransferase